MKIAVIGSKGLPPGQGGIEHHCAEIYPRMVAQGHQVDLYARASYTNQPWGTQQNYNGVNVISLPCLKRGGVDALSSSAMGAIAATFSGYDIIHFHALGPALFSVIPKLSFSKKVVVTCHGLDWQRSKWGKLASRLILAGERSAVRFSDALIVVSNDLQTYFMKSYLRETIVIANAPSTYSQQATSFSFGASLSLEQKRYVLFLGRLVPEKRPDLLIEAFQQLQPEDWKLVLIGANSDTPEFTAELKRLAGHNSNVVFAGELRGEKLAELVRGAGLFVLPSDVEGLPLAMLEAMREGIPVLASNLPISQSLLGQDRGVLFKGGSLQSCVEKLQWSLNHIDELKSMARRAKHYVELHYNWDDITDSCLKVYEDVRSNARQTPLRKTIPRSETPIITKVGSRR